MDVRTIRGAPNLSARALCLLKELEKGKGDILLLVREEEAFADFANAFSSLKELAPGAGFELLFWGSDKALRAQALKFLYAKPPGGSLVLIATPEAFSEKIMDRAAYGALVFEFRVGWTYPRAELSGKFQKAGYTRVSFVENKGEFAVRGSVVDFFPPDLEKPVRLFFTDTLDSARYFEIDTQSTSGFLDKVPVTPFDSAQGKPFDPVRPGSASLATGRSPQAAQGRPDSSSSPDPVSGPGPGLPLADLAVSGWTAFLDRGLELPEGFVLKADAAFAFSDIASGGKDLNFGAQANMNFNSDLALVEAELRRLKKEKYAITLFCINRGETERLSDLFGEKGVAGFVNFRTGYIQEGFLYPAGRQAVLTSSEIFQRRYRIDPRSAKPKSRFYKWTDLKVGDFVVHEDYGVGKYLGIKKVYYRNRAGENTEDADCLFIEYARGDRMAVPLYEFNKVQKYISSEGKTPKLSHMDTRTWHELKSRVRQEVQSLARDILKVEAGRLAMKTDAFPHAGHLEDEFSASFPFEETPDQRNAINDVLSDLENPSPMNRLVVGDVGFGKTEVAMRAAIRAVLNGKQAAVLAPTTILADQHYRNFISRFKEFPANIGVISRFETKAGQRKILEKLAKGELDIVVGTHRLLQKDVRFRNLGLLVIDEEHRFGVKDKEKLKAMAKGVHLLMLSATPIPRTLYQSLSTLKTMSVIESPPVGRLPISTNVLPFDETALVNAVNFELARGGQVYYVHNRVRTIETRRAYFQKLMPYLRVAVVHGQLKSEQIEEYMWDFLNRKYDVLLASTIIESGLDIPSVNTMIVENAHELGLAQLYQLRGRIGREKQKAYCYLFFPSWMKRKGRQLPVTSHQVTSHQSPAASRKPQESGTGDWQLETCDQRPQAAISEDAMKRLSALEEFTELGSGFRLAMRDLEIRGAGELLGIRQHGFINSIGLEMYIKLLNGEISRIKGKAEGAELPEVKIDLELPAFIPEDYIGDDMERLNFYKKLLNAEPGKVDAVVAGLEDLSGPAPQPLKNLAAVLKLKRELALKSVRSVVQKEELVEIFFQPKAPIPPKAIARWQRLFGAAITFLPSRFGDGLRIKTSGPVLEVIKKAMLGL